MLSVDLDRREKARDGRGGEHRVHEWPGAEPALRRGLDAGRHALEAHGQFLDPRDRQRLIEQPAQRFVVVEVRAAARQRGQAAHERAVEEVAALDPRPDLGQARDRFGRRLGGDRRAVDGPDRRPDHEVGDDPTLE